jgi:hypothetical protein
VPNAFRARIYLPGLRVAATVLIDGFVAGTGTSSIAKRAATTLHIDLFESVSEAVRTALEEEADALVRFVEPDARTFKVNVSRS